ncbi:MAG: site-2 protease family protein [Pseudanabaena sp. ELA645]|jgi:Zn-dependent protease/predicted transcriptional regulator
MRGGIRIGSISGIPIYTDALFLFIIVLLASESSRVDYAKLSPSFFLGYGAITALLFFLSIAFNKTAHALMAKSKGLEIKSIDISFIGGTTTLPEAKDPLSVFSIAISAPATSLGLGAIGFTAILLLTGEVMFSVTPKIIETLTGTIGDIRTIWTIIAVKFAQVNLIIGFFSLIPALPLEGGHILKAAIWQITGDRYAGIRWAARVGQFLGVFIMVFGGLLVFTNFIIGLFFILFGWFLFGSAGGYLYLNNLQQALLDINAEFTMTRDFRLVDAEISLREFADKFLLMEDKEANPIYIASSNGRDRGLVTTEKIRHIDSNEWTIKSLQSLVKPLDEIPTVELKDNLATIVNLLEQKQFRYVIVRSTVGSVAGVIDRSDVMKALDGKLKWRIPAEYLKQIKVDGKFPANFRLVEICEQLNN